MPSTSSFATTRWWSWCCSRSARGACGAGPCAAGRGCGFFLLLVRIVRPGLAVGMQKDLAFAAALVAFAHRHSLFRRKLPLSQYQPFARELGLEVGFPARQKVGK